MKRILGVVVFAAALYSAPKPEKPAELTLATLEGAKVSLSSLRGKVVVLNFWATWCGPCREEMPMFVEAEKAWAPKGIVFIGASLDEKKTRPKIPDFLKEFNVRYSVWTGADIDMVAKLGLGAGVPDTAFIDEQGIIFARAKGEITRQDLDERLTWITGDRKGPAPKPLISSM